MFTLLIFGALGILLWVLGNLGAVTLTIQKQISGLSTGQNSYSITDDTGIKVNPTIAAAQPGSLTTRVGNTSGTLTMTNAGHGIITGQTVDLFWAGGGYAYSATVGTVSGTSVPITAVGGGVNLPAQGTTINVGIRSSDPFNIVGNNLQALCVIVDQIAMVVLSSSAPADLLPIYFNGTVTVFDWEVGCGFTNPLAGDTVATIHMSVNGTTASDSKCQAVALTH